MSSEKSKKVLQEFPDADAGPKKRRKPRLDGLRTRMAILTEATSLATVYGLEGLSIGRLAELAGMSKSGLFAHFGSKENLQMAIVATAMKCSYVEFTRPAMKAEAPLERLWGLCDYFLNFVERRVFPGGCFFSAVVGEMHALPERVRERIERHQRGYLQLLTRCAEEAIAAGELKTSLEPDQIVFELHALIIIANLRYVAHGDTAVLDRAWAAVQRLLGDCNRARRAISD